MKNSSSRLSFVILIIPLITLITSVFMRVASGPFWLYADPCYMYLFNALHMVKGHAPIDVSHPGTPIQVLIFIVIWMLNLGQSVTHAVNNILIRPETYLMIVWMVLAASSFLTSILLGAYVYRKTNNAITIILVQLPGLVFLTLPSFNSSYPMLPIVANVTPEPLFVTIMNLFNLLILRLYFAQNHRKDLKNVLLLSFVCGLGLATKLNFFPIFFVGFILVPWRKKFLFILTCVLSFIFWTIPIIQKYPKIWGFIRMMFLHTSRYGRGAETIIDWQSYFQYFKYMIHDYWFFILSALGLFLWSLILIIKDRNNKEARFLCTAALGVLLQFVATAKHFSYHYLVPGFGLFGLIFILFYFYLKNRIAYRNLNIAVLIFIILFAANYILQTVSYQNRLSIYTQDITKIKNKIHADHPNCTVLPTWSSDTHIYLSQEHALYIANGTILYTESEDLSRLYPNFYYFYSEEITSSDPHMESYGIWNFKQRVFADDLTNACPCAIFLEFTSDFSQYPYQVHLLDQSKYLSAFLLINSTEKEANDLFIQAMNSAKQGNYQRALMLGLKSRQLNYQPRRQLDYTLMIIYQALLKSNPNLLNQKQ